MRNWTESTVEEVCTVVTDGSHFSPKAVDQGHYMVSVKDFENYGFNFSECKQISDEDYKTLKSNGCVPEKQDILIGKDGARYFEDIIVYEQSESPALLSSIAILRCNSNIVRPYFLYYYMKNPIVQKDVKDNYGSGSAIPRIVLKDFKRMSVYYPDLHEQDRIVAVLKVIDNKILANEKINKNLLNQAITIFDHYYDESPRRVPFTSMVKVLGGGTPKTGNSEFWDGDIPFFTPKDVGAPYTFQTEKKITDAGLEHCNSRLYEKNTTFVTARGTVGKVSLAGAPMAMNQSCYALASDSLEPILVYFYTLRVVESLKHKASGAVFDAIVTRDLSQKRCPK